MTERALSAILDAACGLMTDLGIYPLAFEADTDGAHVLAVMQSRALLTRSRGPYTPENLPPEALATVEWIALRLSNQAERPEFTVEGGGPLPRLVAILPASRVLVRYVVPEDAPPVYQPKSNNLTLSIDIKLAVTFVAESLRVAAERLGQEPPVRVVLSHPDDPDYEATAAAVPPEFRDHLPPIIPTLELDRSRCDRAQRAAHDNAVRSIAYSDQLVESLGRTGFSTRIGSARIRDTGIGWGR